MTQNSNIFVIKYKDYFSSSVIQIQSLTRSFKHEYEMTENSNAKKYAEELETALSEIKNTVKDNKTFTLEEEKVFLNYIEELINKYSSLYNEILAREALKRYASQGMETYDEIPLWEEAPESQMPGYSEPEFYEVNSANNLTNSSKENHNSNSQSKEETNTTESKIDESEPNK